MWWNRNRFDLNQVGPVPERCHWVVDDDREGEVLVDKLKITREIQLKLLMGWILRGTGPKITTYKPY